MVSNPMMQWGVHIATLPLRFWRAPHQYFLYERAPHSFRTWTSSCRSYVRLSIYLSVFCCFVYHASHFLYWHVVVDYGTSLVLRGTAKSFMIYKSSTLLENNSASRSWGIQIGCASTSQSFLILTNLDFEFSPIIFLWAWLPWASF